MQTEHEWRTGHEAWQQFTKIHPELGYRDGRQHFHNFLRHYRQGLIERDAIRRAKGKFWVAHTGRFIEAAFELSTAGGQHG